MQLSFQQEAGPLFIAPFKTQLLKWIGNKQRFAHEIASHFPPDYRTYYEPFLGSGAVLATLMPRQAVASDAFGPLMEIWHELHNSPDSLVTWYKDRYDRMVAGDKKAVYEAVKASYNSSPNGADLVFLCRSCYGGVVRFRKTDGYMSTPCGVHKPISPTSFAARVWEWRARTAGTTFIKADFEDVMDMAEEGDLIYCDPPYHHSQGILYGAQTFDLQRLLDSIQRAKGRGVRIALSIDGTKKSGGVLCDLPIPPGLFEEEVFVNCGRSMLRRFQKRGESLDKEVVADRLLLTYKPLAEDL